MGNPESGRLIGIAKRPARGAPMELVDAVLIEPGAGLAGDHKGRKFPSRGVTVLANEKWRDALADLDPAAGPADLPWTTRRANLLVEGVDLPRAVGGVVRIGPVVLEITDQTSPCRHMDTARKGLLKALHPDWRGGITCRVIAGGEIALGDGVEVLVSPPERKIRLPG